MYGVCETGISEPKTRNRKRQHDIRKKITEIVIKHENRNDDRKNILIAQPITNQSSCIPIQEWVMLPGDT